MLKAAKNKRILKEMMGDGKSLKEKKFLEEFLSNKKAKERIFRIVRLL
jgi:uncharacterized protein YjgD (DUF1641 family)